ncbi:MAG: 50S ribosomal protein L21 [Ktedonobacteraceae bacterium]|nr:50S ribosomal protein L21 [Ktedonobacteraceae bacterium]
MYAIVKSGGRQYKVAVGEQLEVNRLSVEDGSQIEINEVLLISGDGTSLIGSPFVEGAKVLATVVGQKRGKKVIVFKYKPKKRYRHRRGHRQELTVLTIDEIISQGKTLATSKTAQAEPQESEPAPVASAPAEETAAPAPEKKTRRRRAPKATEAESSSEE